MERRASKNPGKKLAGVIKFRADGDRSPGEGVGAVHRDKSRLLRNKLKSRANERTTPIARRTRTSLVRYGWTYHVNRYQARGNVCRADYTGWLLHRRERLQTPELFMASKETVPEQRATRDWNAQPNWNSVVPPSGRPCRESGARAYKYTYKRIHRHTYTYWRPSPVSVTRASSRVVTLVRRTMKRRRLNLSRTSRA